MGGKKRQSDLRVSAPDWLYREYESAILEVKRREARGQLYRTIWNDIADRTKAAIEEWEKPVSVKKDEPDEVEEILNMGGVEEDE